MADIASEFSELRIGAREMNRKRLLLLTQGGMIAALYVALTFVFRPISFGEVQVRIAEALTVLPMFTPAAVPGLWVGCLLGNLMGGAMLPDVVFGSLATLIGAVGTRLLRKAPPWLAVLPPIVSNMLIVPLVLRYAYGLNYLPLPVMALSVGAGEVLSCGVLGLVLYRVLKRADRFREQQDGER
jgi:uncharacterized membrane protein